MARGVQSVNSLPFDSKYEVLVIQEKAKIFLLFSYLFEIRNIYGGRDSLYKAPSIRF